MMSEKSRREVLQGLGATGFASVFGASGGLGSTTRNINKLTGDERNGVIYQALTDPDARKIREYISKKGWTIDIGDTRAFEVESDELSYKYAVVPFEKTNRQRRHVEDSGGTDTSNSRSAHILWFDTEFDELPSTLGHIAEEVEKEAGAAAQSSDIQSHDVTTIKTVDGEVTTSSDDVSVEASSLTAQSSDGCEVEIVECDSWDWTCIVQIAAAEYTAVKVCGVCVLDPTKLSCGGCLAAIGLSLVTIHDCTNEHGKVVKDECYETTEHLSASEMEANGFNYPEDCA